MANLGTSYRHFLARTVMMVRMLLYGFNIQLANLGEGYQHFLAVSVMMVSMLLYGSKIVIIAKKGKCYSNIELMIRIYIFVFGTERLMYQKKIQGWRLGFGEALIMPRT